MKIVGKQKSVNRAALLSAAEPVARALLSAAEPVWQALLSDPGHTADSASGSGLAAVAAERRAPLRH